MTKPPADAFRDWERHAFGFGYGTGEEHILPALKAFMEAIPGDGGSYDYRTLEGVVGAVTAWLFINQLCRLDILEYGVSSRFGWMTQEGRSLRSFLVSHTALELVDIATDDPAGYAQCDPKSCNCGPNGYDATRFCENPFWPTKEPRS